MIMLFGKVSVGALTRFDNSSKSRTNMDPNQKQMLPSSVLRCQISFVQTNIHFDIK